MYRQKLSIVIPVYNSANSLNELITRINESLMDVNYEVILVDDGSKDNGWSILEELKKQHPKQLIAIKLSRNFGQHNAILCGLNYCKGDFVVTMDDDLQHPPEEIIKLIQKQQETDADVVYGIYEIKQHSALRNTGSYFVQKSGQATNNTIREGSSFRLIKQEIVTKIKSNHQQNFLFIDEVIQWYTSNISSTKVIHAPRKYGKSSYSFTKLVSLYLNILINYSAVPLKLMTYSGLFFSIITFAMGIRFIFRKIVYNVPLGYTSTIVSILFTASIILLCLGIIGQYIYKIYQIQNHKPPFSIHKII